MRKVIFAPTLVAAALSAVVYFVPVSSSAAANFVSPLPKNQSAVVQVNHRRYRYPGYYPYYPPYPAYGPYYYGPPAVAYPPPVIYYPGPRYYPGPAVYGPDGVFGVRRPYGGGAYDVDW
jgi:hypothetical protein